MSSLATRPARGHVFIYGLLCPDAGRVVYAGRTINKLSERLATHFSERAIQAEANAPFRAWKAGLASRGLMAEMVLLATIPKGAAEAAERQWIHHYQRQGPVYNVRHLLVNRTLAGHDLEQLNGVMFRHGLSFRRLAHLAGLSENLVAAFLTGAKSPSEATAQHIADLLRAME